jgi:hypothetical protein
VVVGLGVFVIRMGVAAMGVNVIEGTEVGVGVRLVVGKYIRVEVGDCVGGVDCVGVLVLIAHGTLGAL